MRILLCSAFVGLVLGICGYLMPHHSWVGLLQSEPPEETIADPCSFESLLKFELNHERGLAGLPALETDPEVQSWVDSRVARAERADMSEEAIDATLTSMQEAMPTVHAAAAYMAYAGNQRELIEQIARWHRGVGKESTHISAAPFNDPATGRVGCFTVSVRKLPVFTPRLLDEEVELFYNVCPHCKSAHAGRVPPSHRSVVFACPHCKQPFDAYAMDNYGHYRRVTGFLSHFEAPLFDPPPDSTLEEMYCIWYAVSTRCRYTQDIIGTDGPSDYWQDSMQTFNVKNGDCEDSSILLADWLIGRGIDARVATGKTSDGEGHAWCVARVAGVQYLLETTTRPNPDKPPYTSSLSDEYLPRYLFDREKIYFLQDEDKQDGGKQNGISDYWDSASWLATSPNAGEYESQAALAGDVSDEPKSGGVAK